MTQMTKAQLQSKIDELDTELVTWIDSYKEAKNQVSILERDIRSIQQQLKSKEAEVVSLCSKHLQGLEKVRQAIEVVFAMDHPNCKLNLDYGEVEVDVPRQALMLRHLHSLLF